MKKWLIVLTGLIFSLPVFALDRQDAGEYVLLNVEGKPTAQQMRFTLKGKQWIMDGREGDGVWHTVCNGTGECRFIVVNFFRSHP